MKKVWENKAHSFQEAQEFDVRFWRNAGAAARFEATWSMVIDFLKIRGNNPIER